MGKVLGSSALEVWIWPCWAPIKNDQEQLVWETTLKEEYKIAYVRIYDSRSKTANTTDTWGETRLS